MIVYYIHNVLKSFFSYSLIVFGSFTKNESWPPHYRELSQQDADLAASNHHNRHYHQHRTTHTQTPKSHAPLTCMYTRRGCTHTRTNTYNIDSTRRWEQGTRLFSRTPRTERTYTFESLRVGLSFLCPLCVELWKRNASTCKQ